ncbi:MAG: hypothetical protein WC004_01530 [Candidatus Absconditabacterales bacterium]
MNTKPYLLASLLVAATSYTANNNANTDYRIFASKQPTRHYHSDLYASLTPPECTLITQLALDSTVHRSLPIQSQASVLGLSSLWSYAFASDKSNNSLDAASSVDMPLVEIDAPVDIPLEGSSSASPKKLIAIVGVHEARLDYDMYDKHQRPRLDIYVSDSVLTNINVYGAKKLGIKLAPSDNIFRIYNKADFQFMTLLLSLGGDDGWNFIHIPNCKQKKQTFDTNAWLSCVGNMRSIACDYIDNYQADQDNSILFQQSQELMPGATMLLLHSFKRSHPDMSAKPDHTVRHAICQTIKRETKSIWLAKVGKKMGF